MLAAILVVSVSSACRPESAVRVENRVTASGSSALLPFLKIGQEEFQKKHTKVTVNISAGGSFTGQNQAAAGTVDIGNSDVPLQDSLKTKDLKEHLLVGIPFIFITNKSVGVDNLTRQQYVDILSGKVTNWRQVGGNDQPVVVIGRSSSSGSRATIQAVVMEDARFADNQIIQDSTGAVRATVSTTPGAIGYIDAAYADDTVTVPAYNGIRYNIENVLTGKYPVYSFGRMYTRGEPTGAVKAFIDFVLSDDFQNKYAEQTGFIPMSKMKK